MTIATVLTDSRVPVKIWTDDFDGKVKEQLKNTAALPCVFSHVAAMPDVHVGMGATIGSVIATEKAIIPAAVGVDIGCGMMAVKTDLESNKVRKNVRKIRECIEATVPVGFSGNAKSSKSVDSWNGWDAWGSLSHTDNSLKKRAKSQLGSLGGGNHFIEVCLDTDDNVWIMLHSGSRGVGNTLARRHIETAKGLMDQFMISLPDRELAYLTEGTAEFSAYINDLYWAQDYAAQNRIEMMGRVIKAVAIHANAGTAFKTTLTVNCHHNYAVREKHFGRKVWITRKGAVRARTGDLGIIPGSMGARSFIVRGLGNPQSFMSCAHGAGRRMSRTQAKRQFTVKDLQTQTAGVECRKDAKVLDEIPAAYKDIDTVMANQSDLVEVVATLKQIMCVKG